MHLSKEVKIGLLATVALTIFFVGFYFLKGADIFSKESGYYCTYPNVEGLQNSAVIQISGLNVGHVSAMQLVPGKGVKVTLEVNKGIELPEGTIASINSPDIMGSKMILLIPGPGPGILKPRSELIPASEGGVVENVSSELTPRLKELKNTISNIDTTLNSVNALVNAQNQKEIADALHAINITAQNLAEITKSLKNETGEINAVILNAKSITANLARNNDTINHILTNLNSFSNQLNRAPVQKLVDDLRSTVTEYKAIAEKINDNKGSLGMLVNNKDLYNNLNSATKSLDSLEKDLKAHPGRYLTIFGRKK